MVPPQTGNVRSGVAVAPRPMDDARINQALELFRAGNAKKAWTACWQAMCDAQPAYNRKKPGKSGQAAAYRVLAHRFLLLKDYQNAQLTAGRAVALDAAQPESHAILGFALPRLGDLPGALAAADKAVSLNARFLPGHEARARVLLEMGRPRDAVAHARRAAAEPLAGDGAAWVLLGSILRHAGDDAGALDAYDKALKLGVPSTAGPAVLCAKGHILHDLGRYDEALDVYERAGTQMPRSIEAWQGRVNTLMTLGRRDEAQQLYKRASETVPGYQQRAFDFLHPLEQHEPIDTPADPKRVVLANAISTFPGLPLGPVLIKANVEHNSDFRVTCMDLNTTWFTAVIGSQRDGTAAFHFDDSADLVSTAELFNTGGAAFFDDGDYGPRAELFARYRSLISDAYNTQCQAVFETNGAIPWYITLLARKILAKAPAVVGLSVMFTHEFWSAALLARAVKSMRPDVVTVFGGGFFNEANLEGFAARDFVDYVVLHDGEQSFLDLLNALDGGDGLDQVSGLVHFDAESQTVVFNARDTKVDYNLIPPADFSDYDMDAYYMPSPVVPLISSRGCYWRRCTFCDHFASYAGSYKTQSIVRCVDEIQHHMKATGAKHFTFVDEMISAKRFEKISEEILERGLDIRYFALAKPTADFTEEILEIMYRSGCRCIYWGIESGAARILELMDKGNTVESSSRTLKMAHAAGIKNHLFMIVGFPSETREELWETIEFVYGHQDVIDKILAGPYVMKRGTPIYDYPETFGIAKIYVNRSLCNSQVLRYEAGRGIPTELTGPMAEYLQLKVFDPVSGRHSYFGTPRNHIILFYGEDEVRPPTPQTLPPLDEVSSVLDSITPASKFAQDNRMVPVWNVD